MRRSIPLAATAALLAGALVTPAIAVTPAPTVAQGVLTFSNDAPPTSGAVQALRSLGLRVQGLEQLPLALVHGTTEQIAAAVARPDVIDFYPDEKVTLASTESNHAIGVDGLQELGLTGEGVQVAVVDSGVDATMPDLADHVVHNVRIAGPEDADLPPETPPGSIAIPFDEGPYSNTDSSGHGTFVSGFLAADGTSDPSMVGVAPDVDLIGYSVGVASNFMTKAVAAYDHILDTPEWGIDVVNNSWGTSTFKLFDPSHPINVATKAMADKGMSVVFAAGNGGSGEAEMTLNPYSQAPWVISVAGSDVAGHRWDGSSNGLMMDNSEAVPNENHLSFSGDRLGMYHPTVAAPSTQITSACPTVNLGNCVPTTTWTAEGTSLGAPHVSGLAALLLQAQPGLVGSQLRSVLEASARPTVDNAPLWQVGFGIVDAAAALDLVTRKNFDHKIDKAHRDAERRLLAARSWTVPSSDLWEWNYPQVDTQNAADERDLRFLVPPGTDAVKVGVSFFTDGATEYSASVLDASGRVVGTTTPTSFAGVATTLIDLRESTAAFGEWTLRVAGHLALRTDESKNPARVTVQAALLEAQEPVLPEIEEGDPTEPLTLFLSPDPAGAVGKATPEGCDVQPATARGFLVETQPEGECQTATAGWSVASDADVAGTGFAEFASDPFEEESSFGGTSSIVLYIADAARPADSPATFAHGFVDYDLIEVLSDGTTRLLTSGIALEAVFDGRNEGEFLVQQMSISAGSRLQLRLRFSSVYSAGARFLFGGDPHGGVMKGVLTVEG